MFLKTLHGAVFADAGTAFDSPNAVPSPLVGVGAELRMVAILGWGLGVQGRLGYAFGAFGEGGVQPNSPESLYFRFGSSF